MGDLMARFQALRLDLQKHLTVGALIALLGTLGAAALTLRWTLPSEWFAALLVAGLAGFLAATAAGWAKEYLWDKRGHGTVDRDDYLFTGRGGGLGAVVGMLAAAALRLAGVSPWA